MLTNEYGCGIIIRRSKRGRKNRTLKIKQRRNKDPTILERNQEKSQVLLKSKRTEKMRQHLSKELKSLSKGFNTARC